MKDKRTTSIRLKEMRSELERIAKRKGIKLHTLIFEIVKNWLTRNRKGA